jgi:hypothetical protein
MQQAELADLAAAFQTVIESNAFDADAAYQVDVLPLIDVGPYTTYPAGGPLDLATAAAATDTFTSGQMVRVHMPDALWTPTCALSISQVSTPTGGLAGIQAGAMTGPEGYALTWSNGAFETVSALSSDTTTSSLSEETKLCMSAGLGLGVPIVGDILAFNFSVSLQSCFGQSWVSSHSSSNNESSGVEQRSNASFAAGLRLPITPLPWAPVGSLLAVWTQHGMPGNVIDVRVVQRDDAMVAPVLPNGLAGEVDMHLLVNDVTSPACPTPTDDGLTLERTVITPAGMVAQALRDAMLATIVDLRAQEPAILAQGGMVDGDTSALRTQAWASLTTAMAAHGFVVSGIPIELRNLFDNWVEQELASLSRRGQMLRIERQIDQIRLEARSMENELSNGAAQDHLLSLIPRWRMNDLSGAELETAMNRTAAFVGDYASTIFALRDPTAFGSFQDDYQDSLNDLLTLTLETPADVIADRIHAFGDAVRDGIQDANFHVVDEDHRPLVIAYPRTETSCNTFCNGFVKASRTASARAWAGLLGPDHIAELEVDPASLYKQNGGNSNLTCDEKAPVVRRAAIYLVNTTDTTVNLAALGRSLPAAAGRGGSPFRFPLVGGELHLTADTPNGVPLSLPALNGPGSSDALPQFGQSEALGVGAGISPFTTLTVRFGSFWDADPEAEPHDFICKASAPEQCNTQAVLLLLDVQRAVDNTDPTFVPGRCPDD